MLGLKVGFTTNKIIKMTELPVGDENLINQAEDERKIALMFEQGLNNPEIIAYHGTSLAAIRKMIEEKTL